VKRRLIRSGDTLIDDAEVVVRGGELQGRAVREDALRTFEVYGSYGISMFALKGATIDELAQQAPLVRFAQLALVIAGAIRAAGLDLEPTGRNPRHYSAVLPDLGASVDRLCACEQRLWSNPYHEQ